MWLLGLEAGVAMFLLVFIVWWTMFDNKAKPPPTKDRVDTEKTD